MKELDSMALFKLSVLGPLISRPSLARGELQASLRELAQKEYAIPGSRRRYLAEKTLQAWFYQYRRDGLEGLAPRRRCDHGRSKLTAAVLSIPSIVVIDSRPSWTVPRRRRESAADSFQVSTMG